MFDGSNLRDLFHVAQTCTSIRAVAFYIVNKRQQEILKPYMQSEQVHAKFLLTLGATRGVIVGSCALNMLLGTPYYPTNDLNIIVPRGGFQDMSQFIVDHLMFTTGSSISHRVMNTLIHKFTQYSYLDAHITLTESSDEANVMRIIVNSPTTADMTMMTSGGAVTLYPELTFEGVAYVTHIGQNLCGDEKLGSIGGCHRFELQRSTEFLARPCRSTCPALWRNTTNRLEYFVIQWSSHGNINTPLNDGGVEWRLAKYCQNSRCPFRGEIMCHNEPIPPIHMPSCSFDVDSQMINISDHEPVRFSSYIKSK